MGTTHNAKKMHKLDENIILKRIFRDLKNSVFFSQKIEISKKHVFFKGDCETLFRRPAKSYGRRPAKF